MYKHPTLKNSTFPHQHYEELMFTYIYAVILHVIFLITAHTQANNNPLI